MLADVVLADVPGMRCEKASGPLITPDMVLYREEICRKASPETLTDALGSIVGLEVKKIETTSSGRVARATGLDFNTTPPCGRIRVYDSAGKPFAIRGFYLFVSLESTPAESWLMSNLVLADGDLLNSDFDLYMSIVGPREKRIGIGSYGDGVDRTRPMVIFANPLAIPQLRGGAFMVHPSSELESEVPQLRRVHEVERNLQAGGSRSFSCYRLASEVAAGWQVELLRDPFPTPAKRTVRTSPRGRFRVSFRL